MKIDIAAALAGLARERPVFHSEADFQHALAWHLQRSQPELRLRLEYPLDGTENAAVDLVAFDGAAATAFELKFLSKRARFDIGGETFVLKAHGAQDTRRYDTLEDVARLERFVRSRPGATGCVVALTNDPAYWTGPQRDDTCDAAFALREGREAGGCLDWAPHTGAGTKRGREAAIALRGRYRMLWRDYAQAGGRFGRFRMLCIEVDGVERGERA